MRTASAGLTALLASGQFFMADLYEFSLTAGTLYFTSFDRDITADGNTYSSALGWGRTQWKSSVGLNVDTMDVTLQSVPTDLLPGTTTSIIESIAAGYWDGAPVKVKRAFMVSPTSPAETVLIFSGWVGDITEIGRIHCTMQLQSKIALLDVAMPKALFQPGCRHVLFDSGCTLDRSAFEVTGTVGAGSTTRVIQSAVSATGTVAAPSGAPSLSSVTQDYVNLTYPTTYYVQVTYVTAYGETLPSAESSITLDASNKLVRVASPSSAAGATGWNVYIGLGSGDEQKQNADPLNFGDSYTMPQTGMYQTGTPTLDIPTSGLYALGVIEFLTGANVGIRRTVDGSTDGGVMTLRVALPYDPAEGDMFALTPGCDHTMATCKQKFNNLIHFGGTPYVPIPETTL